MSHLQKGTSEKAISLISANKLLEGHHISIFILYYIYFVLLIFTLILTTIFIFIFRVNLQKKYHI